MDKQLFSLSMVIYYLFSRMCFSGTISIMNEQRKPENGAAKNLKRTLLVTFASGCLTLLIAGGAIVAGILIDLRNDTLPRWTLLMLLFSAPLTLGMVYLLVRRTLNRARMEAEDDQAEEEEPSISLEQ